MSELLGPGKVLLITRNFPPLWGGMERLNWHIADELANRCAVRVIAPKGAALSGLPDAIRVEEVALSPLSKFLFSTLIRTLKVARQWHPDLVLAGSGLTAPIAWLASRICGARAYAYLHGLDITVPNPVYRTLWLPFLRRLDGVIANSNATAKLAEQAGIAAGRITIVHPGVHIPRLDPAARARFRAAHGLGDRPLLLSVGRLTQRKGLLEFIRVSLPTIVKARSDCLLLIVGETPKHALHAGRVTPELIRATADEMGMSAYLRFLGTLSDDELSEIYQAADVHVFPVRDLPNDPEGFGMVAVEAAAHGLPTVAFATGGVVDAVANGVSGRLVGPNDSEIFTRAVLALLESPLPKSEIIRFAENFTWERFGKRFFQHLA
ncbi:glycosyltransferase family 4 protein [Methylococcus sp. EFPC2]|uniref:glycosyltransferase family 4 protein n=1 Tax=Methylococcus sp. EFPC2 TaxID=2812648 RepID=UPI0019677540|nr:glycosyltransferase family 4 protein [Methylococcus sp. EFPC2]QSA96840.1 glycosyltransferase family 4 protein [Methylococcus sp. EFPC2]